MKLRHEQNVPDDDDDDDGTARVKYVSEKGCLGSGQKGLVVWVEIDNHQWDCLNE